MDWSWLPTYWDALVHGLYISILLLVLSVLFGFPLAVLLGFAQAVGPRWAARLASGYCTFIRGTPLLVQLWFLYFGLGVLFPYIPGLRQSFFWPVLREGFFYAVTGLTMSFAGYEGEVMRAAFLSVPKGELEAGSAIGMSRFTLFRRIWFPRAVLSVLPTLAGDVVGQLKATPLAYTITVMDLVGVANMIRQDTYRVYEPLFLVAGVYMCLTFIIVLIFGRLERMVPIKR